MLLKRAAPLVISCALVTRGNLLTINAKTIVEHGHRSIGIERNVRDFMDQEVVARPRADNPEVVNKRLLCLSVLKRNLKAAVFCHSRRLILIAGGFAGAHDTLGLKVARSTKRYCR
jgi:hypothetical protein